MIGRQASEDAVWSRLDAIDRQLDAITQRLDELRTTITTLAEQFGSRRAQQDE